jgi:hypothetical protein
VLYLVAAKDAFISRVFLFNFVPWLYIALLFSHYYLPSLLAWGIFRREDKTLLIGSGQRAARLREWLERKAEIGLRTVGLVSDDDKIEDLGVPLLGRPDQLENVIRDHGITQVILLEFPLFSEANQNVIQICDQLGIRLLILSDLEERLRHSVTHFEDGGFRFIGLREEPLENPLNRFIKRAIDDGSGRDEIIMIVTDSQEQLVQIPQHRNAGGIFKASKLCHVAQRSLLNRILLQLHPIVDVDAEIAYENIEGDLRFRRD